MASANLGDVEAIYEAFGRGDVPAVLAAMDEGIEWREAEGFPYGGTYHGPEAVLEHVFAKLAGEWDDFRAVPESYVDGDSVIVALGEYSGTYTETGKRFQAPFAHVWWLEDGKAVRFQQFTDTALARAAVSS